MKREFVIFILVLACFTLAGCNAESSDSTDVSAGTDTVFDEEWKDYYKSDADEVDDYSWMIPQAEHEIFTEEEKKQIEANTLNAVTKIWKLYENVTIDASLPLNPASRILQKNKE